MKSSFSTRVADDDGAARKRARYEPTGLLPAILACCEAHSPHVDATEIASFLQGSGASLAELEASGAEELSQQVASVWAAKLLLQVSAPSYSSRTAQRPRLSAASPYGAAGACSSAAGCGGAADLHSTAAAPTSAAHKALRVEAGLGSPPCTSEEERSRCDDVDSASDHEPDRRTAGAGGGDGGDGGGGGGGVGGYAAAATRTSFHREPLEELEEEAAGERCGGVGAEADGADADDDAFDELADGYDDGYGKGGGGKQSRRLVWTDSLHRAFEAAVAQLGSENAKPQAIQQLMGVDGITTRNIKSHLQKYRLRLHKQPSHSSGLELASSARLGSLSHHHHHHYHHHPAPGQQQQPQQLRPPPLQQPPPAHGGFAPQQPRTPMGGMGELMSRCAAMEGYDHAHAQLYTPPAPAGGAAAAGQPPAAAALGGGSAAVPMASRAYAEQLQMAQQQQQAQQQAQQQRGGNVGGGSAYEQLQQAQAQRAAGGGGGGGGYEQLAAQQLQPKQQLQPLALPSGGYKLQAQLSTNSIQSQLLELMQHRMGGHHLQQAQQGVLPQWR